MNSDDMKANERKLARHILWKLDIHVLPPLAFVSSAYDLSRQ